MNKLRPRPWRRRLDVIAAASQPQRLVNLVGLVATIATGTSLLLLLLPAAGSASRRSAALSGRGAGTVVKNKIVPDCFVYFTQHVTSFAQGVTYFS